ncbi:exodeoxyribonuclease V subunit beta [Vibrio crassostreae]|uniref:exodeoxyribonuclease V subunit beta n=1 Tax=Vibrio crassostreae TaxID=246167 RepID=UPI001B315F5B|nr:exodeoxyribonuclease V subunit beta [Vibrio crassostreae]
MTEKNKIVEKELNALTVPLYGKTLIEASAGTGKTFTIASLYLRLLLGHGEDGTRFPEPLTVEQILVVTFTEAATEELRDRIRRRIRETRIAFSRGFTKDPVIKPLLDEVEDHEAAAAVLLQAERQMDEAAIFTIHGFCQRILSQNAFESGALFNTEFLVDEADLRFQVVADFWRRRFYGLKTDIINEIVKIWETPADLKMDINKYLSGARVDIASSSTATADDIEELHFDNLNRIHVFKHFWLDNAKDIYDVIQMSDVSKRSFTKKSTPKWIEAISDWAKTETEDYTIPPMLEKFTNDFIEEKTPKGCPPSHAVFNAASELWNNQPSLKQPLIRTAIEECRAKLHEAKVQNGWMSFDDLLTNLSDALDNDRSGILASRIRNQFRFAMIDEFQDTDPMQFNIFSTIYSTTVPKDEEKDFGLFMIGDPKQAIYAFRGADIFTYITARRMVSDIYTLGTNWRSSFDMVNAVNSVFQHHTNPFIYDDDIGFLPIKPASKQYEREWFVNGRKQEAMKVWSFQADDDKPTPKGDYEDKMAKSTAFEIQNILDASDNGNAVFVNKGKESAIEAGDIAVLVRTGRQAKLVQRELAKQNIASVYMSSSDSVFATEEAKDVLRLMNAIIDPKNEMAVRSALSSTLFNMTAQEIDSLNTKDNLWDSVVMEFIEYNTTWSWNGILPMLNKLVTKRDIASKYLSKAGGERQLTNLLHVGELLQQASQTIDSESGLIKWLEENIKEPNGNAEDQQLRLESDKNLVQIVTIHKSKGLEYDIVFMPFLSSYRENENALFHDAESQTTVLDLDEKDQSFSLAEKERLAEDLRILYVGLTRAVYGCYLGLTPIRNGRSTKEPTGVHMSAIGYLLQKAEQSGMVGYQKYLEEFTKFDQTGIAEAVLPTKPLSVYEGSAKVSETVSPKKFSHEVEKDWWVTSYSGLVRKLEHHHDASFDAAGIDPDQFDKESKKTDVVLEHEKEYNIFTFPRGAVAGTFLHTIFEEVEYTESAYTSENTKIISEIMELNNIDEIWLPTLQKLVDDTLNCDLNGEGMLLSDVVKKKRLVEMEFMLPINNLTPSRLNDIMLRHERLYKTGGHAAFDDVSGMLKGFIDLVFESGGKYYVLDWKSNHLGDDIELYTHDALDEAMADHRYDLQYNLYSIALQRFLQSRIPNYSYEEHFGGCYYIFLRGIDGKTNKTGVFYSRPTMEVLGELHELMDKG